MTKVESFKLVALLVAAFPSPSWPEESVELFAEMLADLDRDPAARAVRTWIATKRERPTIADIREATRRQLDAAGERPHEVDGDEAWGYVVEQMRVTGRYNPFPPDRYPEVARVVERMGWITLCDSDNPEADRAHFLRLFELERKRVSAARLVAAAMALPDDRFRIAAQSEGGVAVEMQLPIRSPMLPTEEQRREGAANIRELIQTLTRKRAA